jgi:DNA-binding NarL/FixJ family response regulator
VSIRVLVADDQSMVRAGFRMLLTGEQDIEVVAEASNGLDAVAKTRRLNPAVVLMDAHPRRTAPRQYRTPGSTAPPAVPHPRQYRTPDSGRICGELLCAC